ncbi:MAG: diacylglycerol kinase family protein [Sphingobacteriales bacterium]|nr:MAG: diacylglycerol kinase family protein [Sphingobacteriales bacterium]
MNKQKPLTIQSRINSFGYAVMGFLQLLKEEPNMRIHALASILVVIAGAIRQLDSFQWLLIIVAIALVWIMEAINTAIEMLCDLYCKGAYHTTVKSIKDISAAAMLMASIASCFIGIIVFTS